MSSVELVEVEPMPGRRVPVDGELTIGRHECDLTISSPQVSRRHARVVAVGEGAKVEDLGSRNGTYLNEERISGGQALASGDALRVGETTWNVEILAGAAETVIESRGDVPPPPPPSGIREIPPRPAAEQVPAQPAPAPAAPAPAPPPPAPAPAPPAPAPAGSPPAPVGAQPLPLGPQGPPVSAARRIGATLICYAVVVLTAIAVAIYLVAR